MNLERWRDEINWALGLSLVLLCALILMSAEEAKTSSERTREYIMATVQRKVILQSITDEVTGVTTHRYEGTDIATWLREHRRAIEEAGKT